MEKPSLLDEYSLKRILLGAVIGAAITTFVGFNALGLMFEGTAKELARNTANAVVVEALAPICAENVQRAANATKVRDDLMKASASEQVSFIEKGGWAKFPGNTGTSNSAAVAGACARLLVAPK